MGLKAEQVLEAGLQLDLDERAIVARRLLASLQGEENADQTEVDAAWAEEIGRHVDEILEDKVELVSFEESRERLRARLADLHR